MSTWMIVILAFSALALMGYGYQKSIQHRSASELKFMLGQVDGYDDPSKQLARHGLVADRKTGKFYSQHRPVDLNERKD